MITSSETIHSVSTFNRIIQNTLNLTIPVSWVTGEISNFTAATSGHWYFSLKDAHAQVRCVMFRGRNQFLDVMPTNGLQIEVRATAGLFEARGEFQLQVEHLRLAGTGNLFAAFEQLKHKLEQEGLFDPKRKRTIPTYPKCLGIITSPLAAALQDVLTTLNQRMPTLPIIIYPCSVQGNTAAEQIIRAIQYAGERNECDVLIICRGGGSLEDLWPFNEESVARAIAASPIPTISGVGHETDTSICDFVADLRAVTPTGAASFACTSQEQLRMQLDRLHTQLHRLISQKVERSKHALHLIQAHLSHPGEKIRAQFAYLQQLDLRLRSSLSRPIQRDQTRLNQAAARLLRQPPTLAYALTDRLRLRLTHAIFDELHINQERITHCAEKLGLLNPLAILARGYTLSTNTHGVVIQDANTLHTGDVLNLRFAQGQVQAVVTQQIE